MTGNVKHQYVRKVVLPLSAVYGSLQCSNTLFCYEIVMDESLFCCEIVMDESVFTFPLDSVKLDHQSHKKMLLQEISGSTVIDCLVVVARS